MKTELDGLWSIVRNSNNQYIIAINKDQEISAVMDGSCFYYYFYFNYLVYEREHCEGNFFNGLDLLFSNLKNYHIDLKAIVFEKRDTTRVAEMNSASIQNQLIIMKNDYIKWDSIIRFRRPSITRDTFITLLKKYISNHQLSIEIVEYMNDYERSVATYAAQRRYYIFTNTSDYLFYDIKGVIHMNECNHLFYSSKDSDPSAYKHPYLYCSQGVRQALNLTEDQFRFFAVLRKASTTLPELTNYVNANTLVQIMKKNQFDESAILKQLKQFNVEYLKAAKTKNLPLHSIDELLELVHQEEQRFVLSTESSAPQEVIQTLSRSFFPSEETELNDQFLALYHNEGKEPSFEAFGSIIDGYLKKDNVFPCDILLYGHLPTRLVHVPTTVNQQAILNYTLSLYQSVLQAHYSHGFTHYQYDTIHGVQSLPIEGAEGDRWKNLEAFMKFYSMSFEEKMEAMTSTVGMKNIYKGHEELYKTLSPVIPLALHMLHDYYDHNQSLEIAYWDLLQQVNHSLEEIQQKPSSLTSFGPKDKASNIRFMTSKCLRNVQSSLTTLQQKTEAIEQVKQSVMETQFDYEKIQENTLDDWTFECIAYVMYMKHHHSFFGKNIANYYANDRRYYLTMILETFTYFTQLASSLLSLFGFLEPFTQDLCYESFLKVYLCNHSIPIQFDPLSEAPTFQDWFTELGYNYMEMITDRTKPDYILNSYRVQRLYRSYPQYMKKGEFVNKRREEKKEEVMTVEIIETVLKEEAPSTEIVSSEETKTASQQ